MKSNIISYSDALYEFEIVCKFEISNRNATVKAT